MALSGFVLRFLKRFWTVFRDSLRLRTTIELKDPADLLTRYLFQSNHFKKPRNLVTAQAFLPPDDRQLSTFIINGLDEPEIWGLGRDVFHQTPRPTMYGRADITVGAVRELKLRVFRDDDPPRHVNVGGWPNLSDPEVEKSAIKSLAQELAAEASLHLLELPYSK